MSTATPREALETDKITFAGSDPTDGEYMILYGVEGESQIYKTNALQFARVQLRVFCEHEKMIYDGDAERDRGR